MKKIISLLLFLMLLFAAPLTVSAFEYTDFLGKKIGVLTGSTGDDVSRVILNAETVFYSDISAGVEDVKKGRIDGFIIDTSSLRMVIAQSGNENLEPIQIPAEVFMLPSGFVADDAGAINRFNSFLEIIKADGTLADMQERWLTALPDLNAPMPDIPNTGQNGTIKFATCATMMPHGYTGAGGELKGYCIELALRFAAYEGKKAEFADMDFNAIIPYVLSGKAEYGVQSISITEERKKSVMFTDSIYDDTLSIITLKAGAEPSGVSVNIDWRGGFIRQMKESIERNLITDGRWKLIVNGLGVTMVISLAAQLLGTIFGAFVCFLLTRKNKFVIWLSGVYCGFIHGTPIVVLLMITYYIVFGDSDISNVIVAIAAFTAIQGALIAENLKGAMETVDPVEIEAARSLGYPAFGAFRRIVLPQSVRRVMPSYMSGFVELVKSTAVVGYIAIQDLTRAGDIIRSRTYDQYFSLLLVAVIYLIITGICVKLFKFAVKRTEGGAGL